MRKIVHLLSATAMGLTMSLALAQTPPTAPPATPDGKEHHPGMHGPRDCSKAPDAEKKARCEARQKIMEKCKGLNPEEHHKCIKDAMPKKDS